MAKETVTFYRTVDLFVRRKKADGKQPATLKHYADVLRLIGEKLPRDCDPRTLTEDDIVELFSDWMDDGLASTTRANRASVLREYLRFVARRWRVPDLSDKVPQIKKRARRPRELQDAEVLAMQRAAADRPLDLLLLALLLFTGMRKSELIHLRWRDVLLAAGELRIHGKGDKERYLPIVPALAAVLIEAREHAATWDEPGGGDPDAYVCPSRREHNAGRSGVRHQLIWPFRPLSHSGPSKVLARLARDAKLDDPEHVGTHCFRHYFGVTFLRATGDIKLLSELLGHEDIQTTDVYAGRARMPVLADAVDHIQFAWVTGGKPIPTVQGTENPFEKAPANSDRDNSDKIAKLPAKGDKKRTTGVEPAFPSLRPETPANVGRRPTTLHGSMLHITETTSRETSSSSSTSVQRRRRPIQPPPATPTKET